MALLNFLRSSGLGLRISGQPGSFSLQRAEFASGRKSAFGGGVGSMSGLRHRNHHGWL